ncbi:MAG: YihY/virulence factor BrkB family protein, partial [Rhizobiales bacterium]|nr:YihY/virulence factor BrkB family protein [Hyphomicrobiales bacterium]
IASQKSSADLRLTPRSLFHLLRDAAVNWLADGAPSMGAAIAYYTIFSIAPLLIIMLSIAGFVFGAEAAQNRIFSEARSFVGNDGAAALQGLVESASKPAEGAFATVTGLFFILIGATGVFAELQGAMDRIWKVPARRRESGVWNLLRRRILTFGILLAVAFLLLVSLAMSALISALQTFIITPSDALEVLWQTINFVVSFLVIAALFALLFKLLPQVTVAWRDVVIGAVFTALLFNIGKLLIGLYIGKTGVASGFGAAGSLIVLIVWVYYSAQIFLLGAEFTWLYAERLGSRRKRHLATHGQ